MASEGVYQRLLGMLGDALAHLPDHRQGKNRQYSMSDLGRAAFAVFFCQSPSFLAHQQLMQQVQSKNNGRTLFGLQKLPSDNHIRNHLDGVGPHLLRPVFQGTLEYVRGREVLQRFRSLGGTLLVAIDGTGYFSSEAISCAQCSVAHFPDGRTVYSHTVLMTAIVAPGVSQVLALEPEFIRPQEGKNRQDCEQQAARRWLAEVAPRYRQLDLTLVGDDLYATQSIIADVLQGEMDYIFTAKEESHRYLYEEVASLEKLGEVHALQRTRWTGKERQIWRYRWANEVRLFNSDDSPNVNWVELTIEGQDGTAHYHIALISSHLITEANVEQVVRAGRTRWKIENEDFNTLKTKGYHFEHNFGHGKQFLAQTLLSLNLLAFLFHTVLELLDARCALIRRTFPRRDTFFQHVSVLTQYVCFEGWQQMMLFMLEGLKLADPEGGAPPTSP
jgi:hypothetical protein